jgi:hypothetical protein
MLLSLNSFPDALNQLIYVKRLLNKIHYEYKLTRLFLFKYLDKQARIKKCAGREIQLDASCFDNRQAFEPGQVPWKGTVI